MMPTTICNIPSATYTQLSVSVRSRDKDTGDTSESATVESNLLNHNP